MKQKMDPRTQMFSDVIITAVEGGTGYWAQASAYKWSGDDTYPASVELTDDIDANRDTHPVDIVTVANAMYRIVYDPTVKLSASIREAVTTALFLPTHADLDAADADAVVQVALFGEVVYG